MMDVPKPPQENPPQLNGHTPRHQSVGSLQSTVAGPNPEPFLHHLGNHLSLLGASVSAFAADGNRSALDASLEQYQNVLAPAMRTDTPGHRSPSAAACATACQPRESHRSNRSTGIFDVALSNATRQNDMEAWSYFDRQDLPQRESRESRPARGFLSIPDGNQESEELQSPERSLQSRELSMNYEAEPSAKVKDYATLQESNTMGFLRFKSRFTMTHRLGEHSYGKFLRCRLIVAKFMNNRRVETAVGGLIMVNALVLGIQADHAVQEITDEVPAVFTALDKIFTIAFTIELALRIFSDGLFFFNGNNGDRNWNVFDFLMVFSALADEAAALMVDTKKTANLSAVRILRILRLVRVIRVIRVMRMFQDLRIMVQGIVNCLKPLGWAVMLLCLMMFCFAVCILQFVAIDLIDAQENGIEVSEELQDRYGSLLSAMGTLYMAITGGIDWMDATDPLISISPFLVVGFGFYVAFALFCVLNIVTGVFVENASKMTARDEDHMIMEEMEKHQYWLEDVKRAFMAADKDGNGEIDIEEFRSFQADVRMQAFLRKLGVDWSLETSDRLFKQLDFDKTGTINFDEFMFAIQKLTGSSRAMDMLNLMHDTRVLKKNLAQVLTTVLDLGSKKRSEGKRATAKSEISWHGRSLDVDYMRVTGKGHESNRGSTARSSGASKVGARLSGIGAGISAARRSMDSPSYSLQPTEREMSILPTAVDAFPGSRQSQVRKPSLGPGPITQMQMPGTLIS